MKRKLLVSFIITLILSIFGAASTSVFAASEATYSIGKFKELGNMKINETYVIDGIVYQNYDLGYTIITSSGTQIKFGLNVSLNEDKKGVSTSIIDLMTVPKSDGFMSRPGDIDSSGGETYFIPHDRTLTQMQSAFIEKYTELRDSGYNVGIPRSGVKVWESMAIQDFKFGDSSNSSWENEGSSKGAICFLMYNGADNKCYFITDTIATGVIMKYHGVAPLGDSFIFENYIYQNFSNGCYRAVVGSSEAATFIPKKMFKDGELKDLPHGNLGGYIGTVDMTYGSQEERTVLGQLFANKYNDLLGENINPGFVASFVKSHNGIYAQYFDGSPYSTAMQVNIKGANFIGTKEVLDNAVMLAFDNISEEVFVVRNAILNKYLESAANMKTLGSPVSEEFVFEGITYQNFNNGYIKAYNNTVTIISGKNMDIGGEYPITPEGQIAKLSSSVKLPDGLIKAQVEEMFRTKLETVEGYEEFLPQGLIKFYSQYGVGVIMQVFSNEDEYVALALDTQNKKVVYLNETVYKALKASYCLGAPIGELSKIEDNLYRQIFEEGYVDVFEVIGYDDEFNEITYFTYKSRQGYIYDSTSNTFTPKNYSEQIGRIGDKAGRHPIMNVNVEYSSYNITEEMLSTAFKNAYNDAFNSGFHPGRPDDEYVLWWPTGNTGVIKQSLLGGDGNGISWGRNLMLIYNPEDHKAYMVTGHILSLYSADGASANGYPLHNSVKASDETIIQNFKRSDGIWHYVVEKDAIVAKHYKGELTLAQYEASIGGPTEEPEPTQSPNNRGCRSSLADGSALIAIPALFSLLRRKKKGNEFNR